MADPTPAARLRAPDGQPSIVGHRGAMGYCPENTLASFERAAALGATWVELDVHLSQDGSLVVIHDERLERTTSGHGLVRDHDLESLQRLDAGAWFGPDFGGLRIPTLDEVLDWARRRDVGVDVEIKNAPLFYDGIEAAVLATVERHAMRERVLISSFDHPAVQRLKALEPRLLTGVLYSCRPADPLALARQAGADVLLPHWTFVTPDDVAAAHAAGLAVATWTTSDPSVLRSLIAAGVDAIATNHPDVLRAVRAVP
jgi:glycerophosphoryl diester phosphodiesterase